MKRMLRYLMVLTIVSLVSWNVVAQFVGEGAKGSLHTVQSVKDSAIKLDRTDAVVRLKGFVVEQIGNKDYWFQDQTGRIRVEISKKILPNRPFDEKTELLLTGEVDYDLLEGVEIEVESIEFVTK